MRRWILAVSAVILVATTSAPSSAFDGQRKGFILGGGLGLGSVAFTQSLNQVTGDRQNEGGLVTNFKIGGGFSEQFLLYYHAHIAWFSVRNVFDSDVTIASGVSGIGFTWFPKPKRKGLFFTGTVGISSWDTPFESNTSGWSGFGWIVGIGYEFSPHWALDFSVMGGNPDRTEGGITAKSEFTGFMLTFTGLAY